MTLRLLPMLTAAGLLAATGLAAAQSLSEKNCFENQNPAQVVSACTQILKNRRASAEDKVLAYIKRGDAYHGQRRNKQAMADYMNAQELAAQNGLLKGRRLAAQSAGELAFKDREYLQAMMLFNRAYDHDGSDAEYNGTMKYFVAVSAAKIELFDLALEAFDEAINLLPNWAEARRERGVLYAMKKEHEKSLQDLNRAIELKPTDSKSHLVRAIAHKGLGNIEQARADLLKAIDIDPSNKDAIEELRKLGGAR